MTKQELIKLIKEDNVSVTTLNKGKGYIIYVECGDLNTDDTGKLLINVKSVFDRMGFKDIIFAPMNHGIKSLEVEEKVKKEKKVKKSGK